MQRWVWDRLVGWCRGGSGTGGLVQVYAVVCGSAIG